MKRRRAEVDRQITEVEDAIEIFSRRIVVVPKEEYDAQRREAGFEEEIDEVAERDGPLTEA